MHIEAQKKSGISVAEYCRKQGLSYDAFRTWRRSIDAWEAQKSEERARWRRRSKPLCPDKRLKATQAFWAMHVEAWQWSGLHLRDYASTHRLSPYSLKRWRVLFENEEIVVDWRTMLHPSALPLISTKIGTGAKEKAAAERLTAAIEADAPPPKRATRRRWKTEEKIALLLQAERHGSTITSVAQAHGIATSVMFRWRDQLGVGKDDPAVILPVRLVAGHERSGSATPSLLADLLPRPDGMIEVALADGRLVFAPEGSDPEAVQREVTTQELRP
nr:transposase [Sphingomonas asaccharolytica]